MDKLLWQNIIDGDRTSYENLYTDYFKRFYNYGKKFTTDVSLIEDSIQEVFLEIWRKKDQILEIESPNSYFYSAFRYILLKKLKQVAATVQIETLAEEQYFSIKQSVTAAETNFELRQRLQAALNTLTPRQREAIFLRFYEGLSYEEVAVILNITVKATYKIIARSLLSLKGVLALALIILLLYLS